jgi:hypothetical protein
MFMFDVETLGTESTSVILSMACIYFNPEDKPSYQQLVDSAFFVKFNAKEQIQNHKRSVSKSTLEWWAKQPKETQATSFKPDPFDVSATEGIDQFHLWVKNFSDYKKSTIWARGNLDQLILHSLENATQRDNIFPFWLWRDVRTAVDLLSGSNNGYCDVEYPGFNSNMVIKHDPIHDCAFDAMQLMYGVHK